VDVGPFDQHVPAGGGDVADGLDGEDSSSESRSVNANFLSSVTLHVEPTSQGYERVFADLAFVAAQTAGFTLPPAAATDGAPVLSVDDTDLEHPRVTLPPSLVHHNDTSGETKLSLSSLSLIPMMTNSLLTTTND